jgi:hypothetical protein
MILTKWIDDIGRDLLVVVCLYKLDLEPYCAGLDSSDRRDIFKLKFEAKTGRVAASLVRGGVKKSATFLNADV